MDEGTDSGDILDQQPIKISDNDDAYTLYSRMEQIAKKQVKIILTQLAEKTYTRTPQDHTQANRWRKREVLDGKIDWRMSARNIHNLVRGLTHPYVGAHCTINDTEYKIWKTKVVANNRYSNIEPGKVVVPPASKTAIIKCGDEMLELLVTEPQLSLSEGEYL
jgi:methionyl-tRNA formyltransferase